MGGSKKTAEQVTEGIDASGLTVLVTGGTHGMGKETVRVLVKRGAHVYLAARNIPLAEKVKEEIYKETPSAKINLLNLDLASLESVRTCAKEFLALNVPLNVLICNAGIGTVFVAYTPDGIEELFQVNYLGHVLLTTLLLDKLKETAKETGIEGRIVNLGSSGHEMFVYKEGIQFDEITNVNKKSLAVRMTGAYWNYGQSKLAFILYTKELAKRLKDEGVNITVNCLHPGTVRTNITGRSPFYFKPLLNAHFRLTGMTIEQEVTRRIVDEASSQYIEGAGLQNWLAISPDLKGVTGQYFVNYKEYQLKEKHALDEDLQKRLWDFSMKLISA